MEQSTEVKWAIQVPFLDAGWLYVTEGSVDNIQVCVYNTKHEAEKAAEIWKTCRIVEYHES